MATPRNVSAFTSGFLQTFSAVDAMNSRRRREKLLDERLADERAFRKQNLEFALSREARAQQEFDESVEDRDARREADEIGLDPDATDEELRAAAARSPESTAAIRLERNRQEAQGARVLGSLSDQAIARHETTSQQEGARADPTGVTARPSDQAPSGLAAQVQAAPLPAEVATRSIPAEEIVAQTGRLSQFVTATGQPAGVTKNVDVPADFLMLDEITALGLTDATRAQAIRDRQKAELIEADPRDPATQQARAKSASEREVTNNQWEAFTDVADTNGDSLRQFVQDNPSAGVSQYWEVRNNLSADVRATADKMIAPQVQQAMAEQRLVLDSPDLDPESRDATNARRKFSRSLGVNQAITGEFNVTKEAGIRPAGIPNNDAGQALAENFSDQIQAGPRSAATLPPNKQRQIATQLTRNTANPTGRANSQQLKNLYLAAQMKLITPADAVWASWHGGALPGPVPEHIKLGPNEALYVRVGNNFQLIRGPIGANDDFRNDIRESIGRVDDHFSQFNSKDDPSRGLRYTGQFLGFLGRTEDLANERGMSFSNPIDVTRLMTRWTQFALLNESLNEQWIEGFGGAPVLNPEWADFFPPMDQAIYGTEVEEALATEREEEVFPTFGDIQIDPLAGAGAGGGGVEVSRFLQAIDQTGTPEQKAFFANMSAAQVEQFLIQQALLEQQQQPGQ